MRCSLLAAALASALLIGCASAPAPAPPPRAAPPAPAASAASAASINGPLAAEWRRLAELFRGTPVVFTRQADGNLRVDVPLHYCFDAGLAVVRPPLAAVLDRVAASQRNQTTRLVVTAPADPGAKGLALASERAVNARDHMVAGGVAARRFSIASVAQGGVRVLVLIDAPPP